MNEVGFLRYAYTLTFKRNLQNRWRLLPPVEMDLVVPMIDGKTVQEILNHDGLAGLPARFVEPCTTQWNGPPIYGDNGLAAIIEGGCDVVGCCGVQASITFHEATVRWSEFKIGNGETDARVFVFDRCAYEAAIDGIASLTAISVSEKV